MVRSSTTDDIAPFADQDLKAAADGRPYDVDELREAVPTLNDEIETWAAEIAETLVPENHGQYAEPTVITRSGDYLCIYADAGSVHRMVEDTSGIDDDLMSGLARVHLYYARRHGADPNALGTMDAIVLPRTEPVEQIIAERE